MSYNVDYVQYIGDEKLTISRDVVDLLRMELEGELCESNFLEDYCLEETSDPEILLVANPSWQGGGSGHGVDDVLIKHILPETKGKAQLLLVWEGGDSITGIEVIEGAVFKRKVRFVLE